MNLKFSENRLLKIAYLCLDVTREGQASYAHVHEIIHGLHNLGNEVSLFQPYYVSKVKTPQGLLRFWGILLCQVQLWFSLFRFDCVYIRSHFAAFPTTLIAKFLGKPVILEVNGPYEDLFIAWPWTNKLRRFFIFLMKSQFSRADHLIVVTQGLEKWIKDQAIRTPVKVITNGVNTTLFNPEAQPFGLDLSKPYIFFWGALASWQGIDTLLAATQCDSWPEQVVLVIAGDGKERPLVESNVGPRVKYLGVVSYSQIPGLIAGSLCGVSPKNNFGGRSTTGLSPLKVFEAMACGVPVIVTDFPGQADLVRECRGGIVIPHNDPCALARAVFEIYNMTDEDRKKMGMRGRRCVEAQYSWQHKAEETYQVLLAVCKGERQ